MTDLQCVLICPTCLAARCSGSTLPTAPSAGRRGWETRTCHRRRRPPYWQRRCRGECEPALPDRGCRGWSAERAAGCHGRYRPPPGRPADPLPYGGQPPVALPACDFSVVKKSAAFLFHETGLAMSSLSNLCSENPASLRLQVAGQLVEKRVEQLDPLAQRALQLPHILQNQTNHTQKYTFTNAVHTQGERTLRCAYDTF